jgi:hypothetical protein
MGDIEVAEVGSILSAQRLAGWIILGQQAFMHSLFIFFFWNRSKSFAPIY